MFEQTKQGKRVRCASEKRPNPFIKNGIEQQGRNAVEAERAPAERNARLEPHQTRSKGPAPNIPHVLPNAPERSAAVREELIQIHNAHENRTRDEN